jgi:hypothetical protein
VLREVINSTIGFEPLPRNWEAGPKPSPHAGTAWQSQHAIFRDSRCSEGTGVKLTVKAT